MEENLALEKITKYRKHYIPLESNPALFTDLIHRIGVSNTLAFQDVLSIEDPDMFAFIPRPALALVLVFPTSDVYEQQKTHEEKLRDEYDLCGDNENVMWFKQTINNACGLYGILHAISNGRSRDFIVPNSHLARLLETCSPLKPAERALTLENDLELEEVYRSIALQGDSEAPTNPEDEVDFHYICLVKSHKDGHLYEMDGDKKGPVDRGPLNAEEDVLEDHSLAVIKEFIQREDGANANFSLLVLTEALTFNSI